MNTIIDIARAEIGTMESPANSNMTKYGEWFGLQSVPWCAIFVSWVYAHAGHRLPIIGYTNGMAGCQTAYHYFKTKNLLVKSPVPGDIVLYDWQGDGRYDHVGIFEIDMGNGKFSAIEGNTSLVNDSNGGEVMRRTRSYAQAVFARPQ